MTALKNEIIIKSKEMEIYRESKSATEVKRCMKTAIKKIKEIEKKQENR